MSSGQLASGLRASSGNEPDRPALGPVVRAAWMMLAVLGLTLVVYIAAAGFPFIHDDFPQIVHNGYLTSWRYLPQFMAPSFWNQGWNIAGAGAAYYRPFFMTWLLVNRMIFGLNPAGWHLAVIALHLLATFLVYKLALRLTTDGWTAVVAAILFGLHPAHIEAIAWISGGTEPLMAVLFLGALLAWIQFRDTGHVLWLAASLGLEILAVLSKETALALPAIVFAFAWFYPERIPGAKWFAYALRTMLPFVILDAVYVSLRVSMFGRLAPPATNLPFSTMVLTWPTVLWFYIKHLLWPINLSLFYDTPYITSISAAALWMSLLALALCAGLLLWFGRKTGTLALVGFAAIWWLCTIAPTLNLRVFYWREIAHDRYLYLPSVAFVFVAAVALRHLRFSHRKLFGGPLPQVALILLLAVALSVGTVVQTMPWASSLLLYDHAAQVAPNNIGAVYLLGMEFLARNRIAEARTLFIRATRLAPNWTEPWAALGQLEFNSARYSEAEVALSRARALSPQNTAIAAMLEAAHQHASPQPK